MEGDASTDALAAGCATNARAPLRENPNEKKEFQVLENKKKNESSHGSLVAACALVFPQHPVAHPAEGGGSVLCLLFQGEIPRFAFPFALFPPRVRFSYSASPAAWFLRYRRSGTKLKAKMALTRRS